VKPLLGEGQGQDFRPLGGTRQGVVAIPPPSISSDELHALLREPESTTLEFKDSLPSEREIQGLVAAFANTLGGTLVIGQRPEGGRAAGLAHPGVVLGHIADWVKEVTPEPDVQGAVVDLEPGEHFVVIRVARGDQGPYLAAEGQALERRHDRVAPMTAERLASVIAPPGLDRARGYELPEVGRLAVAVERQSTNIELQLTRIETLSRRLHWTRQLPIRVATAVLGAVVGYVLGVWNPL
jgi:Putative DNA-binding domain